MKVSPERLYTAVHTPGALLPPTRHFKGATCFSAKVLLCFSLFASHFSPLVMTIDSLFHTRQLNTQQNQLSLVTNIYAILRHSAHKTKMNLSKACDVIGALLLLQVPCKTVKLARTHGNFSAIFPRRGNYCVIIEAKPSLLKQLDSLAGWTDPSRQPNHGGHYSPSNQSDGASSRPKYSTKEPCRHKLILSIWNVSDRPDNVRCVSASVITHARCRGENESLQFRHLQIVMKFLDGRTEVQISCRTSISLTDKLLKSRMFIISLRLESAYLDVYLLTLADEWILQDVRGQIGTPAVVSRCRTEIGQHHCEFELFLILTNLVKI